MSESKVFQRLEQAISLIARHPFYPGKQEVVDDCMEDLEERCRQGMLTQDEKSQLLAILATADSMACVGANRSAYTGNRP